MSHGLCPLISLAVSDHTSSWLQARVFLHHFLTLHGFPVCKRDLPAREFLRGRASVAFLFTSFQSLIESQALNERYLN